jgi:hypothetical protein
VLEVDVTVPEGADHDRMRHLLARTESACLVSASLSTPVRVVSRIDSAGGARGAPIDAA